MMLGKSAIFGPLSRANLTTRFAVLSFFCIGVTTAALWYIVSGYLVHSLLEREWEAMAQLVRAGVKEFLTEEDFTAKDRKSVGYKFEALLQHLTLLPDIVRFKAYNDKGVVIWAQDKKLVGKSFADNPNLQGALKGKVIAEASSLGKKDKPSAAESAAEVVEVYVPVFSAAPGALLGVFETHRRPDSILQEIHEARIVVLLVALGGGLLLYVSLFAIVRQAALKIEQQQEHLLKVQAELLASQRLAAVGEMAAAVAHGIGNPLSSIRAAAQVAILDCKAQDGAAHGGRMEENILGIMQQVDRVQKRMQGLLNFAKPMDPFPQPVEINAVLNDVVATLRPRFDEAQVSTRMELDGSLPKFSLDPNHLEQILMVLLTNALEATPKGGLVSVRTKLNNGRGSAVTISVEDTGDGIPMENRERVFEPFFTTKSQGTGIGLSLAKKFVEKNGGTISLCDGSKGGTKVEVDFPLL